MDTGLKPVIFYLTQPGLKLAQRLLEFFPQARIARFRPELVARQWQEARVFLFIMATGIVVRTIAPYVKDKKTDPAVIVLDEKGKYAVSLLSGHLGGANQIARKIADFLQGEAVITTASEVNGLTPLDLWARASGLVVEEEKMLPKVSAKLVNKGFLKVYSEAPLALPDDFLPVADPGEADLIISHRGNLLGDNFPGAAPPEGEGGGGPPLYLRPKNLVLGLGCNRNTPAEEIETAVRLTLDRHNLAFLSLNSLATIDRKAGEPGLLAFAGKHKLPVTTFPAARLNEVISTQESPAAFRALGVRAVAEPAALLAAGASSLLVTKQKLGNVTVAVALKKGDETKLLSTAGGTPEESANHRPGRLYVVGTGPGGREHLTPRARQALDDAQVVVGYGRYLELIADFLLGKKILTTGMTEEITRCRKAIAEALSGKTVALVSGGDPGIYAMAGLVLEILRAEKIACRPVAAARREGEEAMFLELEIIPGISALNACAARLGAPLMHDFAVISLSDRLTPWELIAGRLYKAAQADFVIVLYNPKSRGRSGHLDRAREIILTCRPGATPVGLVRAAMRGEEEVVITTLENLLSHHIDMQTTVIIGNSQTYVWESKMITPRGYL